MDPRAYRYRLGATQTVAVGAASAASTAFTPGTFAVRVVATTACHIKFNGTPVATTNDAYLPANWVAEYTVAPGEKLAVIQNTAAGTLYITELS